MGDVLRANLTLDAIENAEARALRAAKKKA
jgi:hypothetical protein